MSFTASIASRDAYRSLDNPSERSTPAGADPRARLAPTLLGELHGVLRSHDVPAADLREEADQGTSARPLQVHAACVHTTHYGTRSATLIIVPFEPESSPQVYYADEAALHHSAQGRVASLGPVT